MQLTCINIQTLTYPSLISLTVSVDVKHHVYLHSPKPVRLLIRNQASETDVKPDKEEEDGVPRQPNVSSND